jgi:hypothetical protein
MCALSRTRPGGGPGGLALLLSRSVRSRGRECNAPGRAGVALVGVPRTRGSPERVPAGARSKKKKRPFTNGSEWRRVTLVDSWKRASPAGKNSSRASFFLNRRADGAACRVLFGDHGTHNARSLSTNARARRQRTDAVSKTRHWPWREARKQGGPGSCQPRAKGTADRTSSTATAISFRLRRRKRTAQKQQQQQTTQVRLVSPRRRCRRRSAGAAAAAAKAPCALCLFVDCECPLAPPLPTILLPQPP